MGEFENVSGNVAGSAPAASAPSTPASPRRRWLRWLVTAVAVAALTVAGVYGWRAISKVRTAEAEIARASTILENAEADLLVVDEAVQVEIAAAEPTRTAEAIALAGSVRESALEAARVVDDAIGSLPDEKVELAEAIKESAEARAEMMEIAPEILEADAKAATAIVHADQAVAEIKAAEDLSAQAVVEFNKHTAASVKASDDLSIQAEGKLQAAQSLLASATASFPEADFSAFTGYVDAKISLIALAKEIDALWIAGDIAGSNTKLEAYNARDAEIVAMAQALPASVRDPIANAYNAVTAEPSKRYFEARERARSAGDRVAELRETASATD
ncbi:MAG: hypothetical protein WBJ62_01410 [Coriobacteriia bacterium]